QLGGGGAQGVGGLQRVPALQALVAAAAAADVDVELAGGGLARGLDLVLVGGVGFLDRPAPSGGGFGEGRPRGPLGWGGGAPAGLGAVGRAGLAARPLRFGPGRPFGEGGGLALAVALRLLQLPGQPFDLGFELGDTVPKVGDQAVALAAARAGREVHTPIIGKGAGAQRQGPAGRRATGGSEALTKYGT